MIFLFFLLVSIFLDSNIFSVPLVFIASLLLIRKSLVAEEQEKKKSHSQNIRRAFSVQTLSTLLIGVISLALIDVIRMERMGTSPLLYFLCALILIIYGRFFELSRSRFFALLLTGITFAYAYITGYDLISTAIFLLILIVIKWILALISHEKD